MSTLEKAMNLLQTMPEHCQMILIIKKNWRRQDNEILQAVLIMIYSGFRISAYSKMKINMEEQYFRGGVKTRAGKNRNYSKSL